jgi:nitrite reductase/ring-hydroxylating ferredoxin subunit
LSLIASRITEVETGEANNILVVKDKEQIYAFGSKCTHAGAALKNGVGNWAQ